MIRSLPLRVLYRSYFCRRNSNNAFGPKLRKLSKVDWSGERLPEFASPGNFSDCWMASEDATKQGNMRMDEGNPTTKKTRTFRLGRHCADCVRLDWSVHGKDRRH